MPVESASATVRARRRPRSRVLIGSITVLAGALAAGSCIAPRPPASPLVVLISLDTFRADALGALRPGRPSISPALDAFRADAVLCDHAFAPMAFTLSSHMSMFTGLDPQVHRVTGERSRLADGVPTLPEVLHRAGYRTVGWMTNEWLKADFGFGRGFDHYEQVHHDLTYADRVVARALESIADAERSRAPLFLFLHFMDAHSDFYWSGRNLLPYYSPPEFRQGLLAAGDERRFCSGEGVCATGYLEAADRAHRTLPPEELALLHRLYEAGISYLDRDLGEFFAALHRSGLYDGALIVVTSDHGEEFREHGLLLHSQIYEESLAVPLLIKLPGNRHAGETDRDLTSVEDLFPTLVELAGATPPPGLQGRSLVPRIERTEGTAGRSGAPRRGLLAQDKLVRSRYALRTPDHQLVFDLKTGVTALYDLAADPGESHDLATAEPALADRLRRWLLIKLRHDRRLAGGRAGQDGGDTSLLTDEEKQRLKALGYL